MSSILEAIIERKKNEVKTRKATPSLKRALSKSHLAVIGEVKKQSPAAGIIRDDFFPIEQAFHYYFGGSSAISVLTDGPSFGGSINDLNAVASQIKGIPLIRKDFIVDPYQLHETYANGGTAVLLIVSILQARLKYFMNLASLLGLDVMVEINSEQELKLAIDSGADIIAVNNRNLHTFEVDLRTAEKMGSLIPKHIVKVAASGIKNVDDAKRMQQAGYNAVLVGEALMRCEDPAKLIQEMIQ